MLLIVLGIHGRQAGESNSALNDYSDHVTALIRSSDETATQLFSELSRGGGSDTAMNVQNQINQDRDSTDIALARARRIDVPDAVRAAHSCLLLALQMRRDALANIAVKIQPAFKASTSKDAIDAIAGDMARFYASDVLYSDYTVPAVVSALHAAGVAPRAINAAMIESGHSLPNVDWLTPAYIALELGVRLPVPSGKPAPGVHGHRIDSVSVGATTLQAGATNTVRASPPPTFTCTFTNDGQSVETDVVVKVSVNGTSVSGLALVPQTTPGQQATAAVTLNSSPPKGTYTVSATVEQVPGETVLTHNTLSFPVNFQ